MSNIHIMLDLETLSTEKNAHILSIGAVAFCKDKLIAEFENLIIAHKPQPNAQIDSSTVAWWTGQPDPERELAFSGQLELISALENFAAFYKAVEPKYIWSNSASFDLPILAHAYRQAGLPCPWNFRQEMCYRTIKNLRPSTSLVNTNPHSAVADAAYQARFLMETGLLP